MENTEESINRQKMFEIKQIKDFGKLENPIVIEGLPGMGNVGKIALDFMIDELKAEKAYEIYSDSFPHSVFINEENLVELPKIEIFRKGNILFLTGDVQPSNEQACYEFCTKVLDLFEQLGVKEIITTGGIGLNDIPQNPKVYCTGNDKEIIKRYTSKYSKFNDKIHNVVGPIMGVSGLLIGLSKKRNIPAISFLSETFGHPTYLGINGAQEILKGLDSTLKLKLNLKKMEKEIKKMEKEIDSLYKPEKVEEKVEKIDKTQPKKLIAEEKFTQHTNKYIG